MDTATILDPPPRLPEPPAPGEASDARGLTALLKARRRGGLNRLDTFIRLRWYAIAGQFGAVCVIAFGFGWPMLWSLCLALIAASAALNVFLSFTWRGNTRLPAQGAFQLLVFDILQLGLLLFLTGGLANPFATLLIAPVVVSATSLRQWHTLALWATAFAVISFLALFYRPLPWDPAAPLQLPRFYVAGVWVAIVCTLTFTVIYVFRVAQEARRLTDALATTELVIQRERHVGELDGLAAAAAHELGTPLATIALVAKEMVHALPQDGPMREDALLLRDQAQRCRDILQRFATLSSERDRVFSRQPVHALVEEVVAPRRGARVTIEVERVGDGEPPLVERADSVHYALGNLVDNALSFAESRVRLRIGWSRTDVWVEVSDDGPGFSPDVMRDLGEPYLARKPARRRRPVPAQDGSDDAAHRPGSYGGLGLGLFITRTLLERIGARIAYANRSERAGGLGGACVTLTWPRRGEDGEAGTSAPPH